MLFITLVHKNAYDVIFIGINDNSDHEMYILWNYTEMDVVAEAEIVEGSAVL